MQNAQYKLVRVISDIQENFTRCKDHLDNSDGEEEKPSISGSTPSQARPLAMPKVLLKEYIGSIYAEVAEQMKRLKAKFEAHDASFNAPPIVTMKEFGSDVCGEIIPLPLIMYESIIA